MMATSVLQDNEKIFPALALALVSNPRGSLQDLSAHIGISKASLYRFCRTREELIVRVTTHAVCTLERALAAADVHKGEPIDALRRITEQALQHRELLAFLFHYWENVPLNLDEVMTWERELDAFFLRGQQIGVFRIDIAAPAFTEIYVAQLTSLIDAERRGRVARQGLATLIETFFLLGAQSSTPR